MSLTDRELAVLDIARLSWRYEGAREQAMKDRTGLNPAQFTQVLNNLIDRPDVLAFDPLLVKRLRRVREARQRTRAQRRRHPATRSSQSLW